MHMHGVSSTPKLFFSGSMVSVFEIKIEMVFVFKSKKQFKTNQVTRKICPIPTSSSVLPSKSHKTTPVIPSEPITDIFTKK
jgi:hypothetical protein